MCLQRDPTGGKRRVKTLDSSPFHGLETETTNKVKGLPITLTCLRLQASSLTPTYGKHHKRALCHFSLGCKKTIYNYLTSKIWICHALEVHKCTDNKMGNTYVLIAKENSTH